MIQVPVPSMPNNKFTSMFMTQSQKLSNMNEFFNEIMKSGSMFVGLSEVLDFFEIVTRDRIVAHVVGLRPISGRICGLRLRNYQAQSQFQGFELGSRAEYSRVSSAASKSSSGRIRG